MSRRTALWALVIYVGALAVITLGSSPTPALRWTTEALREFDALADVSVRAVERGANVLLFVPAGLLLCFALPRWRRFWVWVLCVAVSVGAELAQALLPGRYPTTLDVLANAVGAAVGVVLAVLLAAIRGGVASARSSRSVRSTRSVRSAR